MAKTASQIEEAISDHIHERLLGGGVNSYSVGGRSIALENIGELLRERRELISEAAAEAGSVFLLGRFNGMARS